MRCGEREAQSQSRETKELAEGPQHDDVVAVGLAGEAILRRADIHERFVDDEQPGTVFQLLRQCEQPVFGNDPPIRIVGIGDDGEIGVAKLLDIYCFCYLMSGKAGGARMFGIGRTRIAARPAGTSPATSGNRIWVPGAGVDVDGGRRSIGPRGDLREPHLRLGIGQSGKDAGRESEAAGTDRD